MHYFDGFGGGWMMILWWVIIIVAVVLVIRFLSTGITHPEEKTALDILKERYARGEITKEEFEEKKKDILE